MAAGFVGEIAAIDAYDRSCDGEMLILRTVDDDDDEVCHDLGAVDGRHAGQADHSSQTDIGCCGTFTCQDRNEQLARESPAVLFAVVIRLAHAAEAGAAFGSVGDQPVAIGWAVRRESAVAHSCARWSLEVPCGFQRTMRHVGYPCVILHLIMRNHDPFLSICLQRPCEAHGCLSPVFCPICAAIACLLRQSH